MRASIVPPKTHPTESGKVLQGLYVKAQIRVHFVLFLAAAVVAISPAYLAGADDVLGLVRGQP